MISLLCEERIKKKNVGNESRFILDRNCLGGRWGTKKYANFIGPFSSEYGSRRTIRRLARNSALLYSVDKRLPDLMVPKSSDFSSPFRNIRRKRGKERAKRLELNFSRANSSHPRKNVTDFYESDTGDES